MECLDSDISGLGFTTWRALPPLAFDRWKTDRDRLAAGGHGIGDAMTADPLALLPEVRTLLVLLTAYGPWRDWPAGSLWIHPHYPAYHRSTQAAERLVGLLRERGFRAVNAHSLPQRHAAFAAGFGQSGLNGLLIHPRYGSRICFQTVLTDMPLPLAEPRTGEMRACLRCGACLRACPAHALAGGGDVMSERCLRHFAPMKREIPPPVRSLLGMRLIGCDDCQQACPMNRSGLPPEDPPAGLTEAARLRGLLGWDTEGWREQIAALGRFIGVNEVRPVRITAAAAMHAGNTGDPAYLPVLRRLERHEDVRIREMAAWAIARIEAGKGARCDVSANPDDII